MAKGRGLGGLTVGGREMRLGIVERAEVRASELIRCLDLPKGVFPAIRVLHHSCRIGIAGANRQFVIERAPFHHAQ